MITIAQKKKTEEKKRYRIIYFNLKTNLNQLQIRQITLISFSSCTHDVT